MQGPRAVRLGARASWPRHRCRPQGCIANPPVLPPAIPTPGAYVGTPTVTTKAPMAKIPPGYVCRAGFAGASCNWCLVLVLVPAAPRAMRRRVRPAASSGPWHLTVVQDPGGAASWRLCMCLGATPLCLPAHGCVRCAGSVHFFINFFETDWGEALCWGSVGEQTMALAKVGWGGGLLGAGHRGRAGRAADGGWAWQQRCNYLATVQIKVKRQGRGRDMRRGRSRE